MELTLKRQTNWGCVRHFTIYKNGVRQGRLFNSVPVTLNAETGDTLEFREGVFRFYRKIEVTSDMKEIVITNREQLSYLFMKYLLFFFIASTLLFSIQSLIIFSFAELFMTAILCSAFRFQSYQFILTGNSSVYNHYPQFI